MRRFIISILLIACVALAVAQQPKPYITRWKLKANETIEIPLIGSNFSYRWYKANQDPASATAKVATTWLPNNALKVTAETEGEYILEAGPDGVAAM